MRTHLRLRQVCIFMMQDCVYEERLSISLTVEFLLDILGCQIIIIFRSTCLVFRWTILTATANIEQGRYMFKGIYHIKHSLIGLIIVIYEEVCRRKRASGRKLGAY